MVCNLIRSIGLSVAATTFCLALTHEAQATTVTYNVANVSGTTWQYDYSVTNDTLGADLVEFTVVFDRAKSENLTVAASPVGWDSLVVQPDSGLPDDGFFDSVKLAPALAVGASQPGFSVRFDLVGVDSPGSQTFYIVDPDTLLSLETGTTSAVPLPGAGGLLGTGALLLFGRPRRRSGRHP